MAFGESGSRLDIGEVIYQYTGLRLAHENRRVRSTRTISISSFSPNPEADWYAALEVCQGTRNASGLWSPGAFFRDPRGSPWGKMRSPEGTLASRLPHSGTTRLNSSKKF